MSLKRVTSDIDTLVPSLRRTKPARITYTPFNVNNVVNGETVHQSCLLVQGSCHSFDNSGDDFIAASVTDCFDITPPPQNWPIDGGQWKTLVMLSPGRNRISLEFFHVGGVCDTLVVAVDYVPLLQLPPLHLAVLVARDSPLLIDCPSVKRGAISSTHGSLEAAISKFRLTAYMWQALTAADSHSKDLGRRSFRLDEEWGANTTRSAASSLRCCPKVHIVKTEKSISELRNANYAQQNQQATHPNTLLKIFEDALKTHGAPFETYTRPVVAGLILDSTFSIGENLIVGHTALGCHRPDGLSLGIFGSHLTYSWPRFMEEVPACLMDPSAAGDTVGNDNGECNTLGQACHVSQRAFLHEVGHAFGAQHTSGIMARGYSKHWQRAFLGHTDQSNDASWDLQDVLGFRSLPHFWLPGDTLPTKDFTAAVIDVGIALAEYQDGADRLEISCAAGLARIRLISTDTDTIIHEHAFSSSVMYTRFESEELLSSALRASKAVKLSVLANNGVAKDFPDIRRLMPDRPYIVIPGLSTRLSKFSAHSEPEPNRPIWHWTTLLHMQGRDGVLHRATAIDLRIGCTMDGAVIHYADSSVAHCGPNYDQNGQLHRFGGHASQKRTIPAGVDIVQVELDCSGWAHIDGIRLTLDNGMSWGHLSARHARPIVTLKPPIGERIVGFYGRSERASGYTANFGIITAPKDIVLPDWIFGMEELKNVDGGLGKVEDAQLPTMGFLGGSLDQAEDDDSEDSEEYDNMSEHTLA